MLKSIYFVLKRTRINLLYRQLKKLLPSALISWVNKLSANYDPTPLVIVQELEPQYVKAVRLLSHLVGPANIGDYLEFGVCHGTSLICMNKALQKNQINNIRLFGFDSFEGLPPSAAYDPTNNWQPGEFASSIEFTTENLSKNGIDWNRTFLIKGWYSETLTADLKAKYKIEKASLINIDCDLHSSAKEALDFCAPLIRDSAVVFFDDWTEEYVGEKQAFDEFLKENSHYTYEDIGAYKPAGKIFLVHNIKAKQSS
ncbi:TylF/MycF/NovP-related O-methyltransferase [Chryseolinea sp. H1M3-3]|uniref:TylF/MycF/NovP-related O-methyltransferase n=1 Tax=Chryseolinea sp. H1M3-3 TaxID=3034144 RepID=UPI0023EB9D5D|nr:TylF/MycF/NovP-related O-methyltransferase [Chryseolinea sp. H1M3-3]